MEDHFKIQASNCDFHQDVRKDCNGTSQDQPTHFELEVASSQARDYNVNQNIEEDDLSSQLSNMEVETDSQSSNVIVEDVTVNKSRVDCIMSAFNESTDSHVTIKSHDCLTSFYISVVDEPCESHDSTDLKHIKHLLKKYEMEQGAVDELAESR